MVVSIVFYNNNRDKLFCINPLALEKGYLHNLELKKVNKSLQRFQ